MRERERARGMYIKFLCPITIYILFQSWKWSYQTVSIMFTVHFNKHPAFSCSEEYMPWRLPALDSDRNIVSYGISVYCGVLISQVAIVFRVTIREHFEFIHYFIRILHIIFNIGYLVETWNRKKWLYVFCLIIGIDIVFLRCNTVNILYIV